jgi:hypothetical protein
MIRRQAELVSTATLPFAVTETGFESWYPGCRDADRNWGSLKRELASGNWSDADIESLSQASDKVVAHLPNPHGDEHFRGMGLVLGYVQSGKTTNFTAVIAKAADAGYGCFIVLSGIHEGLRQQTQARLTQQLRDQNPESWRCLTEPDRDFQESPNVDADLQATQRGQHLLIVIKKNASRLRRLRDWLGGAADGTLTRCPTLIIDDEADQASINTATIGSDPTTINRLIREIVAALPKVAYVGYTATPFANVLVDPSRFEDLYPRDFIIDLPRPDRYIGPEVLFGREPLEFDPDGFASDGADLIRSIATAEAQHLRTPEKVDPTNLAADAPALASALRYFLLSTAARRLRSGINPHATALVHTSQSVAAHSAVRGLVESELVSWRTLLAKNDPVFLDTLAGEWTDECSRVSPALFDNPQASFDDLRPELAKVAADISVITDNSSSSDRLSYEGDRRRTVIAVGGNTLSRGLTLEGLSVSYFVRSASAYDTLLQMGRWFGYRHGYEDLTRIWLTDEMRGWFHHLATVEAEIRSDIERYDDEHVTPLDVGVAIRTHPKMAITAASKMRGAVDGEVSYSGRRLQTILFRNRDADWLRGNLEATRVLLADIEDRGFAMRRGSGQRGDTRIFGPVPSELVLDFLSRYQFHEASRDLESGAITRYIAERMREDELTHFHVAVLGREVVPDLGIVDLGSGGPIGLINRARLDHIGDRDYADIKALMSKSDRAVDLDVSEAELKKMTEGEISLLRNAPLRGRGDGSGLLAIYPIAKDSKASPASTTRRDLDAVEHMIGVGLVFPVSGSRTGSVSYKIAPLADVRIEEADDMDPDAVEAFN